MSTASELLELYVEAEKRILKGQRYEFAGRTWTGADLSEIREERERLERRVYVEERAAKGKRTHSLATFP
ncbi:hypothetical protein [Marinobacter salarius]|uniref:hypothetical protein n=1 Tax=Marinobacter salarius TaxID=1420917 RepID=UPI003BA8BCD2